MKTPLTLLRSALLIFTLFTLDTIAFSQKWFEMTQQDRVNYNDVCAEADKYFAEIGTGPHTGYKLFKRWQYHAHRNLDDNGFVRTEEQMSREKARFDREERASRAARPEATSAADWKSIGPFTWTRTSSWSPGQGRIVSIAAEPVNQQLLFGGSPSGGIWRSTNAGQSWTPLIDNQANMGIWAIAIDPNNSNVVYYLNGNAELMKSTNQGTTWSLVSDLAGTSSSTHRTILFKPGSSTEFYVTTSSGVFKTTNGGTSFTSVLAASIEDLAFKPNDVNTVYACGADFYVSTNGGSSFTKITSGITVSERMRMAVTPADPTYVYLVQKSGSGFGRVYRSTNSGTSFTVQCDINNGAPNYIGSQASRDMSIVVSSTNKDMVCIAGLNNYRSTNGGVSFTSLADWSQPTDPSYIHADVNSFYNVNGTFYASTDGGFFRSTNNGDNYSDLTKGGLAVSEYYRGSGTSPYPGKGTGLDANRITAGAQDNGCFVMKGANKDWYVWLGADGMETFIDYTNDNILYGTTQNGSLYRSTNGGTSYSSVSKPISGDGNWVTPFDIDPVTPTTIYAGYDNLYKHTSSGVGGSWVSITSTISIGGNLDEFKIAPSNNNYIYIARGSSVWRTTNGQSATPTWTSLTGITGGVNFIAIDPNDPTRVAIVAGSNVYLSTNSGTSWQEISGNLPNISANCIVFDNTADNGMYVGMSKGIYYKDDKLTNWESFSENMPQVSVSELEIHYATSKIRAFTYGRGVWESPLRGAIPDPLAPTITASASTAICSGKSVEFTANTNGATGTITYKWYKNDVLIQNATSSKYTATTAGDYNVEISNSTSSGKSSKLTVTVTTTPTAPTVQGKTTCSGTAVTLSGTTVQNAVLKWYSTSNATVPVFTGNSFLTNPSNTTTYYVEQELSSPISKVGKTNTTGGGGYHTGGFYLKFNATKSFVLKSALIDANSTGVKTLVVLDEANQTILTKDITLTATGAQRVQLDLTIPQGNNMSIGFNSGADLYRNNAGVSYPYQVSGLVSITTSSAATTPEAFYYYLYDWEVSEAPSVTCVSARTSVIVTVDVCTGLSTTMYEGLTVFPNPTEDVIHLTIPSGTEFSAISVKDLRGNTLLAYGEHVEEISLERFPSGMYYLEFLGKQGKQVFKVVVK